MIQVIATCSSDEIVSQYVFNFRMFKCVTYSADVPVGEKSRLESNNNENKKEGGKKTNDKARSSTDGSFLNDDGWIDDDENDKRDVDKSKSKSK